MSRVYTISATAQMVSISLGVNDVIKHAKGNSVSLSLSPMYKKSSVAIGVNKRCPQPTRATIEGYSVINSDLAEKADEEFRVYWNSDRIILGHRVTPLSERWSWVQRFAPLCPSF